MEISKQKIKNLLNHIIKLRERIGGLEKRIKELRNGKVLVSGNRRNFWIIKMEDICYLKGDGNEPKIFTDDEKGEYRGSKTMGYYLGKLPTDQFIQVHRSYVINIGKIWRRKGDVLKMRCGTEIPLGRNFERNLDGILS